MGKVLGNLHQTLAIGLVLAIILALVFHLGSIATHAYWAFVFRWLHVFSGVLWVGLLYYLNFVQVPNMPKIPLEQRPAITKVIAPAVLFFFRHAALATVITGLILAGMNMYILDALMFRSGVTMIGIGMWLGLIMAFNVWFLIWPNQQKVLGLVPADEATKVKAARIALMASRTNLMLSIPMLFCMVAQQNVPV
jgi:uncharacterized membrane protein